MSATIQIKRSTTPGKVPSGLSIGELAINTVDGKLYFGDGSTVRLISTSGSTGGGGGTVTSVQLSNGTGISLSGTNPITTTGTITITNTAPDQTVTLGNGTGISVTGTYPNFTIANTSPDQTVTLTNGTGIGITGTYPNFTITNTAISTIAGYVTTSSFNSWTGSNTASFSGTASYARTSSYALNGVSGGAYNYVPLWSGSNSLTSSILYQTGSSIGINTAPIDLSYPLSFASSIGPKINLFNNSNYGFGVDNGLLQIFANASVDRVGIGYGNYNSFTETLTVRGDKVGIGITLPSYSLDVIGSGNFSNTDKNAEIYINEASVSPSVNLFNFLNFT
jgi:hypothetical protein